MVQQFRDRNGTFQSLNGHGFKANFFDVETREEYWISVGPQIEGNRLALTHIRVSSRFRVSMEKNSYSRSEVLAAGDKLPERGPLCHECGARIPVFEELSEADERRVRQCIRETRHLMAMEELRAATGCSLEWAKLWVQHDGRPKPTKEPTPCPYCRMPLRTSLARQCRFCWKDWHGEENVVRS